MAAKSRPGKRPGSRKPRSGPRKSAAKPPTETTKTPEVGQTPEETSAPEETLEATDDAERGETPTAAEPSRPPRRIPRGDPTQLSARGRDSKKPKPTATSKTKPPRDKPAKSTRRARKRSKRRGLSMKRSRSVATSTIVMFVVVGLFMLGVIGYGVYRSWDSGKPFGQQRAQQVDGVVNYRVKDPKMLGRTHVAGPLQYKLSPPVGGNHNTAWSNCEGDVYTEQIPNEHAVHSLEHGAVWITYRPDLPADQISKLARKVRGEDFMLMSPYPGLDSAISLQAWGFQLKVKSANDSRIDEFIKAFRRGSSVERGSTCSGGITQTGTTPVERQAAQGMQ